MAFVYRGEKVDLGFGRGWLDRPAAQSIFRIDRQLGHPMQITEAGRTWLEQDVHYQHYLRYGSPIALNPNTPSLHQKGNAADSNEAQRIIGIMEDHGWRRTVYRWVNGKWTLVEPWHFEYFEHLDNHRNDPAGGGTTPKPAPEPKRRVRPMLEATYRAANGTVAGQARLGGAVTVFVDINEWGAIAQASGMGSQAVSDGYLAELIGRVGKVPPGLYDDGTQPLLILALEGKPDRYGSLGLNPGRAWALTSTTELAALQRAGAEVRTVTQKQLDAALLWAKL